MPLAMPVTTPEPFTVATAGLLEDHVTVLLDAVAGATVAARVVVEPAFTVAVVGATVAKINYWSV